MTFNRKSSRFYFYLLILGACSSQLSDSDIFEMARQYDPQVEYVLQGISIDTGNSQTEKVDDKNFEESLGDEEEILTCYEYGEGCSSVRVIKIMNLNMVVVEYEEPTHAEEMAMKIDAYVRENWLFDDVTREPVLEKFVQEAYGAHRPLKPYLEAGKVKVVY